MCANPNHLQGLSPVYICRMASKFANRDAKNRPGCQSLLESALYCAQFDVLWANSFLSTIKDYDQRDGFDVLQKRTFNLFKQLEENVRDFNKLCREFNLSFHLFQTPVHCVNQDMARRFASHTQKLGFSRIGRTFRSLPPEIGRELKDYRFVALFLLRQVDVYSQTKKFLNLLLFDGLKGILWYYDPCYQKTVKAPKPVARLCKRMSHRIASSWDVWEFIAPWKEPSKCFHLYRVLWAIMQFVRYGQLPVLSDAYLLDYPLSEGEQEYGEQLREKLQLAAETGPQVSSKGKSKKKKKLQEAAQEVAEAPQGEIAADVETHQSENICNITLDISGGENLQFSQEKEGLFLSVETKQSSVTDEVLLVTRYEEREEGLVAVGAAFCTKEEAETQGLPFPEAGTKFFKESVNTDKESTDEYESVTAPTACEASMQTEPLQADVQAAMDAILDATCSDTKMISPAQVEDATKGVEESNSLSESEGEVIAEEHQKDVAIPGPPDTGPSDTIPSISCEGQGGLLQETAVAEKSDLEGEGAPLNVNKTLEEILGQPPQIVGITPATENVVTVDLPLPPGFEVGDIITLPPHMPAPDFSLAAGQSSPKQVEQCQDVMLDLAKQLETMQAGSPSASFAIEVEEPVVVEAIIEQPQSRSLSPVEISAILGPPLRPHETTREDSFSAPPPPYNTPASGSTTDDAWEPSALLDTTGGSHPYTLHKSKPDPSMQQIYDEEIPLSSSPDPSHESDYEWKPTCRSPKPKRIPVASSSSKRPKGMPAWELESGTQTTTQSTSSSAEDEEVCQLAAQHARPARKRRHTKQLGTGWVDSSSDSGDWLTNFWKGVPARKQQRAARREKLRRKRQAQDIKDLQATAESSTSPDEA